VRPDSIYLLNFWLNSSKSAN